MGSWRFCNYQKSIKAHKRGCYGFLKVNDSYFCFGDENKIELGFGIVYAAGEDFDGREFGGVNVTATFGYRYQPVNGGYIYRIGLTPFFIDGEFQLWGGISFGNAF